MSRRGENIYKRKDGRYEARFPAGADGNGKTKYKSVYAKTYHEVKKKLIEAKADSYSSHDCAYDLTVEQWFALHLTAIGDYVKITTHQVYVGYVKNHIVPILGKACLSQLTADAIQYFVDCLRAKHLSCRTIKSIYHFFRKGIQKAEEKLPLTIVWSSIHIPSVTASATHAFTRKEQKQLECMICSLDTPIKLSVFLCLYTGLRLGEVCALKWTDIDFEAHTLSVQRTLQRISLSPIEASKQKTKLIFLPPKSQSSRRTIPLPDFLIHALLTYQHRYNLDGDFILSDKPVNPRTIQAQFRALLKHAALPFVPFHSLRHTFATRALELGFDIKSLSEILGHCTTSITLNLYTHSLNEFKRSRMELLSTLLE